MKIECFALQVKWKIEPFTCFRKTYPSYRINLERKSFSSYNKNIVLFT